MKNKVVILKICLVIQMYRMCLSRLTVDALPPPPIRVEELNQDLHRCRPRLCL